MFCHCVLKDRFMKFSQILFRITFFALAMIYLAVLAEFVAPSRLNFDFELRFDLLILTLLMCAFVYIFLRRAK